MEGTRDCDNHIAAYCTRSADDFEASDFFEFEHTLDIDGDLEDDPVSYEMIHASWKLLHDNTDLIRFAFCWVRGDNSDGQDVIDHLNRGWPFRVHLRGDPTCSDPLAFMHAARDLGRGGRMAICTSTEQWTRHYEGWRDGGPLRHMCVALNLSAAILHELCHVVWIGLSERGDRIDACADVYLIQNVFRWAMFRRYPDALATACCNGYKDAVDDTKPRSSIFGDDASEGIEDC